MSLPAACEQTQRRLSDWISGERDDSLAGVIDAHLATCDLCRAYATRALRLDRALAEEAGMLRVGAIRAKLRQALIAEVPLPAKPAGPAGSISGHTRAATSSALRKAVGARRRRNPRGRQSGVPIWLPVGIAAAAVLVLALFLARRAPGGLEPEVLARVETFTGAPELNRAGTAQKIESGTGLAAGDVITVPGAATLTLGFGTESTRVVLDGGARVRVAPFAAGKQLELQSGTLNATVAPQPAGKPFVFLTPLARAEVLGTRLVLAAQADRTRLDVTEGRVRLTRGSDGASVEVPAAHTAVAERTGTLVARRTQEDPPPKAQQIRRMITRAEQETLKQRAAARGTAVKTALGEFTYHTFTSGRETMPYRLYVPKTAGNQPLPLVLFLHGLGGAGKDNEKHFQDQPFGAGLWALPELQARFPCIIVAPQAPRVWDGPQPQLALGVLDEVLKKHSVDPRRIYLTGLSSGGNGVFNVLLLRPKQFAAAVAQAGWIGDPKRAPAVTHVPLYLFHGTADPTIKVDSSRLAYDIWAKANGDVRYDELEGAGHGIFGMAYNTTELPDWLFARILKE